MNIIDIHCHPALKTWLFPKKHIYNKAGTRGLKFTTNLFVNLHDMKKGGVNAAVSVFYLPEAELKVDLMKKFISSLLVYLIEFFFKRRLKKVLEDKSSVTAAFLQIKKYIWMFDKEIEDAKGLGFNVEIAHSYHQFQELIASGKTVFLQSIEGAHCLGRKDSSYEALEKNIQWLFEKGICQITPGHFFENVLVSSQGGIPPEIADEINYDVGTTFLKGYNTRDNIAIRSIDKMLDLGIIVDLVHCDFRAKQMIYERNDLRLSQGKERRPLVFSHTGIREIVMRFAAKNDKTIPQMDQLYLPDEDDIKKIKECNGVFGIIFMDYWLYGLEGVDNAIKYVIDTIEFIKNVPDRNGEKNYEHIALGSDLDGFTEVPADLAGIDRVPGLLKSLKGVVPEKGIEQICFENYNRVLKNGWGK